MDGDGQYKTNGGDEFYVSHDAEDGAVPTAVAIVHDNKDGSYSLTFVTMPPFGLNRTSNGSDGLTATSSRHGNSHMQVHLQHTCFVGTLHQPTKDGWKTGGAMNVVATFENVPQPKLESWQERLAARGGVLRNTKVNSNTSKTSNPILHFGAK